MKKNVFTILLYIFVFVFVSDLSASVLPTVRIGVITDGYLSRLSINTDVLEEEIIDLLSPEFNIIFPSAKRVSGRWSVKSIKDGVEKLLSDPDVDIIITAGLLASDYVLSKKYTAKPVFIPYDLIKAQAGFCFNRVINSDLHINKNVRKFSCVIDDQFQPDKNIRKPLCVIDDQSLPDKNSRKFSSVVDDQFQPDKYKLISKGNIIRCMVTSLENISESIKEFKKVINFNRLCIIEDSLFAKMNPYRKDRIKIITKQSGIEIIYKQVGFNAKSVSVKSNNKFDAVLIMPLLRFSEKEFTSFVLDLNKNKIPCFSVWGKDEVEKGVFLATSAGFSSKRHARKTALEIQQFLLDKKQLRPDTKKTVSKKLSVNMISAEMIGFRPNWRMITQADLVYKEKEKKDSISISDSVREALRNNLTIKTEKDNVRVNKQIEKQAKSVLLPRFDISAYGLNIDSDRASASFGMFAEQTAGIKAQVSQIIYDDLAITNYAVMKQLYKSAQMDLEIEELNIIYKTAATYLNILKAASICKIQKDNLNLSWSNLKRAENRRKIGVGNPAEVFRLETKIANSRKLILNANANFNILKLKMKNLLQRSYTDEFTAASVCNKESLFTDKENSISKVMDDPEKIDKLVKNMLSKGIVQHPLLKRIDFAILSKKRIYSMSKRMFYTPSVSLFGGFDKRFVENEKSSLPFLDNAGFPENNDTDWQIGIKADLNLFSGGYKKASVKQAKYEISSLYNQRKYIESIIEENIYSAMINVEKSYPVIKLSKDGFEAAEKNFKLITDSYEKGVVSVIDLIDAQNTTIVARLLWENSFYAFLSDILQLEYATGSFNLLLSSNDNSQWIDAIGAFFNEP